MTIRRLLFVLIASALLLGANEALASCPIYQGKYADLADKLRRIPPGGQRVLAETCQLVVPTVGPAFGCRSMLVTDVFPGPSGWTAQRLVSAGGIASYYHASVLVGPDLCPAYVSFLSHGVWSPYEVMD